MFLENNQAETFTTLKAFHALQSEPWLHLKKVYRLLNLIK